MLQELKKQAEMNECTFKPQTYSSRDKRNFDQFLKDQVNYEEQKRKKTQERVEQTMMVKQQELRYQPKVNRSSARMVEEQRKRRQSSGHS